MSREDEELKELLREETAINKLAKKILLDRLRDNPKYFSEKEIKEIITVTSKSRLDIITKLKEK